MRATENSASPFDRRRVFTPASAVLTLGNSLGLVCHGFFSDLFGSSNTSSSTSATDAKITATEEAKVITGGTFVEPGALAIGAGSTYTGPGALTVAGPVSGTITIESADANVLSKLLDVVQGIEDRSADSLDATIAKVNELAISKQTDGESLRNNTVLWVTLGVLGLLGVVFYGKPK